MDAPCWIAWLPGIKSVVSPAYQHNRGVIGWGCRGWRGEGRGTIKLRLCITAGAETDSAAALRSR